jgi:uracil-DNA glycosylase
VFNPARLNQSVMQQHIPRIAGKICQKGQNRDPHDQRGGDGRAQGRPGQAVGQRKGTTIPIAPEAAQPERQQPSKLDECRRCELWQFATQAVGGEGPKKARIMFVGEQPGDQEDLAGQPFVGPAGKLLDQVCEGRRRPRHDLRDQRRQALQVGAARQAPPAQDAGAARNRGLPLLARQGTGPGEADVIVALGATALKSVMRTGQRHAEELAGQAGRHEGRWVVTTYHPSYVLRVPGEDAKHEAFRTMVDSLKLAHELLNRQPEEPSA